MTQVGKGQERGGVVVVSLKTVAQSSAYTEKVVAGHTVTDRDEWLEQCLGSPPSAPSPSLSRVCVCVCVLLLCCYWVSLGV